MKEDYKKIIEKIKNKKLSTKVKDSLLTFALYFGSALVLGITAICLHDHNYPPKPFITEYIHFYGIPFANYVPTLVLVGVSIGWILHGVGFTIIKR